MELFDRTKVPKRSSVLVWNVIVCSVILVLRSQNRVEDERDNFFQFNTGFAIYMLSFIFYMFHSFCGDREGPQPESLPLWIVLPVVVHVAAILFGAPFFKNWDLTLTYSLVHTAMLLPVLVTENRIRNSFDPKILNCLGLVEYCSIAGAWCSAAVIPLDWDRPWQVWPEPCCVGAVLGCLTGSTICLISQHLFKEKQSHLL